MFSIVVDPIDDVPLGIILLCCLHDAVDIINITVIIISQITNSSITFNLSQLSPPLP